MAQHLSVPVVCNRCDKEWDHDPVYDVECPTCDAGVGAPCMRPSGHAAWEWHAARELRCQELGKYGACPLANCIVPPIIEVEGGHQQLKMF